MSTLRPCQICGGLYVPDAHLVRCCPACLLALAVDNGAETDVPSPTQGAWSSAPVANAPMTAPPAFPAGPVVERPPRRPANAATALAVAVILSAGAALVLWLNRETQEAAIQRTLAEAEIGPASGLPLPPSPVAGPASQPTRAESPRQTVPPPAVPSPAATPTATATAPPTRTPAPTLVKLAMMAPARSAPAVNMQDLADRWAVVSAATVKLVVYAGGVRGDDRSVVMEMKRGSLGAAVLGASGLAELDPAVNALSMPMAYGSDEEAYAVLAGMRSRLEASLEAKGFVVLSWADAGAERFFSTRPVATPGDLKKLKLFQSLGDPTPLEIWKAEGFSPRPATITDLRAGLTTGLFEACSMSPQTAQIGRYYERAKYMTDLDWTRPIVATVVTTVVWNRIPAEFRPALMEAAREAGARMREDAKRNRDASMAAMVAAGLTIVPVDEEAKARWLSVAEAMRAKMRGATVPADAFDEALKLRDEYRARKR